MSKIGYLGPTLASGGGDQTTFGYQAARQYFSEAEPHEYINYRSHHDICQAVAREEIDFGVVAVENTLAGFVSDTLSGIRDTALRGNGVEICGEVIVKVELFLLRKEQSDTLPEFIVSKGEALEQCSIALRNFGVPLQSRQSTGEAAEEAASNSGIATVGSRSAEEFYDLVRVIPHSIVNISPAFTRFWVIGKKAGKRTGNDKTTIMISLKQAQAGALFRALGAFEARSFSPGEFKLKPDADRPNLLCIHTVPIGSQDRQWEYHFLLEFAGHIDDPQIDEGLVTFSQSGLSEAKYAKVLGSYPAALQSSD